LEQAEESLIHCNKRLMIQEKAVSEAQRAATLLIKQNDSESEDDTILRKDLSLMFKEWKNWAKSYSIPQQHMDEQTKEPIQCRMILEALEPVITLDFIYVEALPKAHILTNALLSWYIGKHILTRPFHLIDGVSVTTSSRLPVYEDLSDIRYRRHSFDEMYALFLKSKSHLDTQTSKLICAEHEPNTRKYECPFMEISNDHTLAQSDERTTQFEEYYISPASV